MVGNQNENVIEVKNLKKQYLKNVVLHGASFGIKRGAICGLIGPNGAGKTTIMKLLGGLVLPTDGSFSIFGETDEQGLAKARGRVSFMIETPYAKGDMTARENLERQRLQKGIPDKKRVDEVLEIVGLADTGKKKVKNFSLGMRQRLGIAIALLSRPELMILDEPINGLDPEGIIEIRELLQKLNREEHITIVISSHILSELSLLCTDYIFIHHGEIINQLTAEEMSKQCKKNYHIDTNDNEKATVVLEQTLNIHEFDVDEDGSIHLYEKIDEAETISRTLFEAGIIPTTLQMVEANLEQFYMDMVKE